jgi:hypothetical protein
VVARYLFRTPTSRLNTVKLLGLICLLFVTAGLSSAQTPTVSIGDVTANEGDPGASNPVQIPITLSAPSSQTVSVLVSTQSGTATSDVDFGGGSVTATFTPGQTSLQLTIFYIGDTAVEGTEQFFVNLSNPVNCTIADGQGVATIIDDDALVLLNQENSTRAAALDSVLFRSEVFPIVNERNFSSDQRTRIMVFAIGLKLAAGETATAVTASAEDSQGGVRPLTVEFVGKVPGFNWLTQVVLTLNDQIPVPGDEKIRITLHGQTSNAVLVAVKAQ